MKKRNNVTILVWSSVVCLLPILFSLAVYHDLPAQVAIHWDSAGNPDSFVPKALAAFGLPALFAVLNLMSKLRLLYDPKRAGASAAMRAISLWLPPVLSLVLVPVTLSIAMGADIPISLIAPIFVGMILLVCGNYLPKSRQNYAIGIKLPWTLHSADIWNKTHRMAGYLYLCAGIVLLAGTFLLRNAAQWVAVLAIALIALLVTVPALYSFVLYQQSKAR